MCGGVHYGEVEGLVSIERWSCSRGTVKYFICGGIIQIHSTYCQIYVLGAHTSTQHTHLDKHT